MSENDKEIAAVWVDVETLTPWDKNPRQNDEAVEKVADSIKRFGFGSPIVARRADNTVIAGHTRLKAAESLGLAQVPVRFLDLDPADAALLALADNRVGEIAEWDQAVLSDVLKGLNEEGVDLEVSGFTPDELDGLLGAAEGLTNEVIPDILDHDSRGDEIPDEIPALTKFGDRVELGRHRLVCGDCVEVLKSFPDDSFDAVVCDPPYGIGFMGKQWDCEVPGEEWARECLRVLKPGGHLIAFAATRTVHRLGVALEDAGFEIRDMIAWVQWQGFPKSLNISKAFDKSAGAEREIIGKSGRHGGGKLTGASFQVSPVVPNITKPSTDEAQKWHGWGTALKPAFEPAILVRAPFKTSLVENVRTHGTGGLNVDGCRLKAGDPAWLGPNHDHAKEWDTPVSMFMGTPGGQMVGGEPRQRVDLSEYRPNGRWPANVYHVPKPSRGEREAGCEDLKSITGAQAVNRKPGSAGMNSPRAGAGATSQTVKNFHPTVKPVGLMRWLVRLVTPPEGVVLDTFAGSGTTLVAAELEGIKAVGIEREPEYCDIVRARVSHFLTDEE